MALTGGPRGSPLYAGMQCGWQQDPYARVPRYAERALGRSLLNSVDRGFASRLPVSTLAERCDESVDAVRVTLLPIALEPVSPFRIRRRE